MSDGCKRVAKVPARTGAKIRLVLRRGAGDTVHIRAYKFNQVYARTARFGECGKTAVLIATARGNFRASLTLRRQR